MERGLWEVPPAVFGGGAGGKTGHKLPTACWYWLPAWVSYLTCLDGRYFCGLLGAYVCDLWYLPTGPAGPFKAHGVHPIPCDT